MRKILLIMMACLALGLVTSCQELPEPSENVKVPQALYLQDAEDITSTTAFLRGSLDKYSYNGKFYFLVSETESFADSLIMVSLPLVILIILLALLKFLKIQMP